MTVRGLNHFLWVEPFCSISTDLIRISSMMNWTSFGAKVCQHASQFRCAGITDKGKEIQRSRFFKTDVMRVLISANARGENLTCWVTVEAEGLMNPPWQLIDRNKERWKARRTPETKVRVVKSLCSPRWQWRNFPPSWGTFFSYQAPRGPGKKTLLSSSYTLNSLAWGGGVTVCVCVCVCQCVCSLLSAQVARAGVLSCLSSWSFHCLRCCSCQLS